MIYGNKKIYIKEETFLDDEKIIDRKVFDYDLDCNRFFDLIRIVINYYTSEEVIVDKIIITAEDNKNPILIIDVSDTEDKYEYIKPMLYSIFPEIYSITLKGIIDGTTISFTCIISRPQNN